MKALTCCEVVDEDDNVDDVEDEDDCVIGVVVENAITSCSMAYMLNIQ